MATGGDPAPQEKGLTDTFEADPVRHICVTVTHNSSNRGVDLVELRAWGAAARASDPPSDYGPGGLCHAWVRPGQRSREPYDVHILYIWYRHYFSSGRLPALLA